MKSWIAALTSGAFAAQMIVVVPAYAAAPATQVQPTIIETAAAQQGGALNAKPDAGGLTPCLLNCYVGPRVGTEYNEGRGVSTMEWIALLTGVARLILAAQAYQGKTMSEYAKETGIDSRPIPAPSASGAEKGGIGSCLVACYLGPRVAFERNEGRKIRSKEIWLLIPILNIVAVVLLALEAYNGKTMTQIAREEGLDA